MKYLEKDALLAVYNANSTDMEKYCAEEKANALMAQLTDLAIKMDCYMELQNLLGAARNYAHMEYDTSPGHFRNWFWFFGELLESSLHREEV